MIFLTVILAAQIKAGSSANGAAVFAQQCSVPYCHGAAGAAARAPGLAGTRLSREQLRETISKGRPKLGMPAFASKLNGAALDAVAAYILSLPAPAAAPAETAKAAPAIPLSKAEADGRDLFFDSERLPSCGTCHAVNGMGGSIAGPIASANFTPESLERVTASGVVTATPEGEASFPALRQSSPAGTIRLADLSSPLPVIRTFRDGEVSVADSGEWSHAGAVKRYSASEIQSMLAWLRAVTK